MEQYQSVVFAFFFLCVAAEALWSFLKKKKVYSGKETLANVFILAVNQALKPLTFAWAFTVFEYFKGISLFQIESNPLSIFAAIVFVDFLYYWQHRLYHEVKLLWTIHHVHHSSVWMNLSTAFRINWFGKAIGPFFFVPAILLGFEPNAVLGFFVLNLFYQFFLHTEAVGKIRFVEGILNTPSAHRVHHGSNPSYIDKNYGGVLMLWDRFFGSYQEETEKVAYGVTTGFQGHNPFRAQFQPLLSYIKGSFKREKQALTQTEHTERRRGAAKHIKAAGKHQRSSV